MFSNLLKIQIKKKISKLLKNLPGSAITPTILATKKILKSAINNINHYRQMIVPLPVLAFLMIII